MLTFALLSAIILVLWNRVSSMPYGASRDNKENSYTLIVLFIILILAAFRSARTGSDTRGYILDYKEINYYSWSQIPIRYEGYSVYYYLSKVFAMMHLPLFVWFGFVEFLYLFAVKRFIDKHSKDKLLSLLVFVSMGLFTFSLAGMKQVMAMAFMLYAYCQYTDKKYIRAAVWGLLSSLCHSVSLIFLPAFVLYSWRNRNIYWSSIIIAIVLLVLMGEKFMLKSIEIYSQETGNDHFSIYEDFESTHSSVMLIYYIALILFCVPGLASFKKNESGLMRISLGLCMVACGLQVLAFFLPHAFRFAYYFIPFYMLLLPNSLYYMKGNNKSLMTFVIIVSLVFYFLYVNRNFHYSMDYITF